MKIKEQYLIATAVVLFVGFRMAFFVMKWQISAERNRAAMLVQAPDSPSSTHLPRSVELTIDCKSVVGPKEYSAMRMGMTFEQVKKIMHLKRFNKDVGPYINRPGYLYTRVLFKNPDYSTIAVVFRNGKTTSMRGEGGTLSDLPERHL